jgi:hypothetical protein
VIEAGEVFVKAWRFENVGAREWAPDYSLVFISGDRMEGQRVNSVLMTRALREYDNGLGIWVAPRLWR